MLVSWRTTQKIAALEHSTTSRMITEDTEATRTPNTANKIYTPEPNDPSRAQRQHVRPAPIHHFTGRRTEHVSYGCLRKQGADGRQGGKVPDRLVGRTCGWSSYHKLLRAAAWRVLLVVLCCVSVCLLFPQKAFQVSVVDPKLCAVPS